MFRWIDEATGPDAWHWAAKEGILAHPYELSDLICKWHEAGQNDEETLKLGKLLMEVAGAYLEANMK